MIEERVFKGKDSIVKGGRKKVFKRKGFFRFLDLPSELRNMIYKLTVSYDSIQRATNKLYRMSNDPVTSEYNERFKAIEYFNEQIGRYITNYRMRTPPILLLNKQVNAEALASLRVRPVIIEHKMARAMEHYTINIAHLIPFQALKKIEHIHFEVTGAECDLVKQILCDGGKLTADINQRIIRRMAKFPGILKAPLEVDSKDHKQQQKKNPDRPLETYAEGEYNLRLVSFESVCGTPMMLDLTNEDLEEALTELLDADTFDEAALVDFITEHGEPCQSYKAVFPNFEYYEWDLD